MAREKKKDDDDDDDVNECATRRIRQLVSECLTPERKKTAKTQGDDALSPMTLASSDLATITMNREENTTNRRGQAMHRRTKSPCK